MKSKAIIESSLIPFSMQPIPNNPLFSKSKIYVMYHGENRNGSNITKENVERNLATIKNIPIIGEFDKNSDNFKGHGGKLELSEDGIEFIHTTKPLGVVPESATTYWEIVKDKKGIEREYLVVDGAYMWNRYEKEVETLKEENFGQSMELEVFDGEWVQDDRIFDIKDFAFSALCILGIDRDGSGHVEPAFGDAKIITYSKSELQDELSEMLKEFKYSLSNDAELGSKEDNELNLEDLLKKYSITVEDLEEKSIKYSEMTIEELEQEIEKSFSEEDASDEESKEDEENASDEVTSLIALFTTFLNLYKSANISYEKLQSKIKDKSGFEKERCEYFLELFYPLYNAYEEMLKRKQQIDFSDMINQAVNYLERNKYVHQYKYLIIDEFQDNLKKPDVRASSFDFESQK